jgi:hypothetical protein
MLSIVIAVIPEKRRPGVSPALVGFLPTGGRGRLRPPAASAPYGLFLIAMPPTTVPFTKPLDVWISIDVPLGAGPEVGVRKIVPAGSTRVVD